MKAKKFIPQAMLCSKDITKFMTKCESIDNVLVSEKLDGVRCMATEAEEGVIYVSRRGNTFKNFWVFDPEVASILSFIKERVPGISEVFLDGEVIDPSGTWNTLMTQVHRLEEIDPSIFQYSLFDIGGLPPAYTLSMRLDLLSLAVAAVANRRVVLVPHIPLGNLGVKEAGELTGIVDNLRRQGKEGLVVKDKRSPYMPGKESVHWCKLVGEGETYDLPVVGVTEGKGRHEGRLGALICQLPSKDTVNVGTGYTDEEREVFFKAPPALVEIRFREKTPSGSLRFPSFIRVREDK